MAGKKTGKRLLTWVLVLVMALSLLPLNALAANRPETDSSSGMIFTKQLVSDEPDNAGNYTILMTAQATGTTTTTTKVEPMDIVLVLDQSGSMGDEFDNGTRQSAMKAAVNSFIGEVAAKYSDDADHRMAIVTFGSDAETLKDWTSVDEDGAAALTGKISGLTDSPSGATNVGEGMEAAQALMGSDYNYTGVNTDRQKTVIVFTDGVPTTYSDFDTDVANTAISAAKIMKGDDVTIYTIGIFNGANPNELYGKDKIGFLGSDQGECSGEKGDYWQYRKGLLSGGEIKKADIAAGNRFLNYLSSNYEANKIGVSRYEIESLGAYYIRFTITDDTATGSNQGYYKTASDASSLKDIFKVISDIVPAPDNAELNGDTVITDTLSDYFTFATGTVDGDVKVYAGQRELINGKDITVNLNPTTKTVTVTDYDFSKHHTESDDPEELVIEIKVKPSGDGCTSKEIPTNNDDDTAGTHAARVEVEVKSEDGTGTETKIVTSHETAKVTGHKVFYNPDNDTGNIMGDGLYYPQGAVIAVTDNVPTREGYKFTGWEITAPKDGETTLQNGKFTMPAADVTLTAQWKLIETPEPTPATVTLKETDVNGNALINKHLTITAKEVETIKDAYFCVAVTAADNTTEAAFNTEPRYATTTTVERMTRTSDGTAVEGSFVFPEQSVLTFSEVGTYTFTVKEVFDEYIKVNHTTYDDAEYTMTVTVTKDTTENKLNAAVSFSKDGQTEPTTSITFNNTYKTPVIPTYTFDLNDSDIITVNKKFESKYGLGSPMMRFTATATIEKQESYTVEVDPDLPINPYPNNGSAVTVEPTYKEVGKATGTVTLRTGKTTKAFDFGENSKIPLEPGDYRITVKETNGGDRYVTYDTETYTSPTFTVNDKGEIVGINTPITCTFTNVYTKRHTAATPSKPTLNTGDHYAYVMGYPDGTVRPNGSITRAEVSAILFRLLSDKTRDEYFTTESSFTDVKAGAWYNNSIATLEKAGVIVDTAKGGAFRPNEAITRAELAAMLAQFSDAKPVKGVKFSDVSAEHWAYEAIAIAAKMGWIEGYPDGTFRPDATITRAEMMTLVNRALERVPSDEDHLLSKRVMLTFPDCKSGDWFYIAVQEATNSHTYERAATEKNGDEQWTALRANRDWTQLEK